MLVRIGNRFVSLEEQDDVTADLAVNKVNTTEGSDDEFDVLVKDVANKVEEDEQKAAEETGDGDNPSPNSDDENQDPESNQPDEAETEGQAAMEAIVAMHDDCLKMYGEKTFFSFAQEDFMETAKNGLIYLKDLGIHYAPIVGKHLFNASMFALNKAIKAMVYGTKALAGYAKKRLESFQRSKSKLQKAKEALALLDTTKKTDRKFDKKETIERLLAKNDQTALMASVTHFAEFLHTSFTQIEATANTSLAVTRNLIGSVTAGISHLPNAYRTERPLEAGFEKKEVPGYEPKSSDVETYCYKDKLPGNMYFIAQLPTPELESLDAVKEAYRASSMFFGIDTQDTIDLTEMPFMDAKGLKAFIGVLEAICDEAIKHEAVYKSVEQGKEHLKLSLRGLGSFLTKNTVNSETAEGMTEIVSLRTAHIDKTYVAGYMAIHNYTVRVLSAGLTYVKANITALSQAE